MPSEQCLSYAGTRHGIGEGIVVIVEGDTEKCCQMREREGGAEGAGDSGARLLQSAQKHIVGIVHTVVAETSLDTPFVEIFVVGHQWQGADKSLQIGPYFGKGTGAVGIRPRYAVDLFGEAAVVIVGSGAHKLVEGVGHRPCLLYTSPSPRDS